MFGGQINFEQILKARSEKLEMFPCAIINSSTRKKTFFKAMVLYVTAVLRRSLTVRPFITGEILPFLLLIGRTIFVILIGHISAVT